MEKVIERKEGSKNGIVRDVIQCCFTVRTLFSGKKRINTTHYPNKRETNIKNTYVYRSLEH